MKSWNFILAFSRTGKYWEKATGPGKSWKFVTAVISHTRPPTIFSPFRKLRFGGRQSNVSMTITASGVSRTTISM